MHNANLPKDSKLSSDLIPRSLATADRLEKRRTTIERKITRSQARLSRLQAARLWVGGIFFLALVIAVAKPAWRLEPVLLVVFALIFTPLVIASRRQERLREKLTALLAFITRQRARLRGEVPVRPLDRALKAAETLPLARDLGTVGPLSLFTLLDETLTDEGERRLLERISEMPSSREDILKRQNVVKSLRHETWLYTRLTLEAHSAEFRLSSQTALETLKHPFVAEGFETRFYVNIAAWILAIIGFIWAKQTGALNPGLPFLLYLAVGFWAMGRSEGAFNKGVGLENHLWHLSPIFARIEKRTQLNPNSILATFMPQTAASGPSREMKRLGRVLSFAGIQANPLLMILVNAVLPWSITATYFLERRRRAIAATLPQCLKELAELEVEGSLALMMRYQTDHFPEIIESHPTLMAKGIFHPLLKRDRVVANDFAFVNGKTLGLLTGSNMSGKSTFLRTLGLNQILANMGGPVFAESFTTSPLAVETCIEVSDSLRDGFSYFYAEVRRLKHLIENARGPKPVLYLIDEIFRGTNNRERQVGSRAVIRSLAMTPSLGFISTHDLELTHLEGAQPRLMNLHFREEIRDGHMHFTYALHDGPCPTTNALRIMEAEGIDVAGL
jgi:hypothetical protein